MIKIKTKKFIPFILNQKLAVSLLALYGAGAVAQPTFVTIGDSTVATYKSGTKQGWGSQFGSYLESRYKMTNYAKGGESSKSFYRLNNWKNAKSSKAKYLLIQFGHNDTLSDNSYKTHLEKYVDEARTARITPVLVTPMRRVRFSNGRSTSNLGDYDRIMEQVAQEKGVALVDLHELSGEQYNRWGSKNITQYFVKNDQTHTNSKGAKVIAGLVVNELKRVLPETQSYFKDSQSPSPDPDPNPNPNPNPDPPTGGSYDPRKDPAYNGYKWRPGEGFKLGKYKLPPKPKCIREVTRTINVSGTFDGEGCLYTWKGSDYKNICFAPKEISEGLPPMFNLRPGATLRNVHIECAPDGIHTSSNNTIDGVVFRDVEEDAITLRDDITIINSQFWFCNDKCLQMNNASTALIQNNRFYYAKTAILAHTGRNIDVKNNRFYQSGRASIRSRKSRSLVFASGNFQEEGYCLLYAEESGILEDRGGNTVKNVKNPSCEISGGRIVRKP